VRFKSVSVRKPEYPERTNDHGQATGKLYHLWLRVDCTLFVIYKAGRIAESGVKHNKSNQIKSKGSSKHFTFDI
jgi:hypothetical protein